MGYFYAAYDHDTGYWCVFHTEKDKVYASYISRAEAEDNAEERNGY